MSHRYTDVGRDGDADLLARARTGDQRAYAELWRRYAQIARAVARTYWWSADSDDLVAESFTRIYQALQAGKGPKSAFKPYLFATMRNLAISWGRARREIPIEHIETVEDPASTDAAADADFDASLVSKAILALPERWQEVLWFGEVENLSMQEIGKRLDITERAAAVLAFRAREGLRQAWIAAHLTDRAPASKECRWTLGKIGAHARRRLTVRDDERVRAHLEQCGDCRARADEARQASSRMLSVLFPAGIALGGGAQVWESLTSVGASATAAPMPVSVTVPFASLATAKAGLVGMTLVTTAALGLGMVSSFVSNDVLVSTASASQSEAGLPTPDPAAPPTAPPDPASSTEPAPAPTAATPAPEVAPVPEAPQKPAPPAAAPPVGVPAAPVILSIPSQVSRTQWIYASVRCEAGADLSVSAYGVTIATGTCAADQTWQAAIDVSSSPVPSGTAISFAFAQSNIAGISGSTAAEVVVVD
ncbi:sigma-70 family RNA polymerase sigma factor [Microbacterium sp. NPDC058269]|uniref:sigma-70 family RNA polymerase sigma factor n=1 Tax=Microbacterium sp. NPDC058269 TaxID=3346414 RepID=UPI0036DAD701